MLKKAFNNGYLEKNILNLIKDILKAENDGDVKTVMRYYLKQKHSLSIGETTLCSLILGNEISFDYVFRFGTYVGFFNEGHYLEKYKSTFRTLATGNFIDNMNDLNKLYGSENMKRILYFFLFFKTKKLVSNIWIEKSLNVKEINDKNVILNVSKKDFAFIEISKIVGRMKELEIHSFYRDNLLNDKLKSYFLSLGLGFKKMNYITNVSSDNVLIPDLIDSSKRNLFILEKGFRENNKNIFKTDQENFVIILEKYME